MSQSNRQDVRLLGWIGEAPQNANPPGTAKVLIDTGADADNPTAWWSTVAAIQAAGAGEANTASTVGTGADIVKGKTGTEIELRGPISLSAALTITVNGDNVEFDLDLTGLAPIDTVFGRTDGGDIIATAGDYTLDQITETASSKIMTAAERTKLAGIEAAATVDQTGGEIKTAYELEADTNAFTDAEQTKLAGVETGATADQGGVEIKVAYEGEADTNAFTDSEKSKLAGVEAGAEVNDYTLIENEYTASGTLTLADGGLNYISANHASTPIVLTVPPNSSVPFAIGTEIMIEQRGAAETSIAEGAGVTINKPSTMSLTLVEQHAQVTLRKTATDVWVLDSGGGGSAPDTILITGTTTATDGRNHVIVSGTGPLDLPATLAANSHVFIANETAGDWVIGRNGNLIMGAAADLTIYAGQHLVLSYRGAGDWLVSSSPVSVDGGTAFTVYTGTGVLPTLIRAGGDATATYTVTGAATTQTRARVMYHCDQVDTDIAATDMVISAANTVFVNFHNRGLADKSTPPGTVTITVEVPS